MAESNRPSLTYLHPVARLRSLALAAIIVTTLAGYSTTFGQTPDQRTFQLDVVELVDGNEAKGLPEHSVDLDGYRYLFANAANRKQFEEQPKRFQVQMDGGCGRMGSLSGRGSTDRWAVHNNQLYVFASDACRKGFLADPESMLEQDDPRPELTDEEMAKGKSQLLKVLDAMGGATKIDSVLSYHESSSQQIKSGEQTYLRKDELIIDHVNDQVLVENRWDDEPYTRVLAGDHSFFRSSGESQTMYGSAQREFRRQANRDLITILKARNRDDYVVAVNESHTNEQAIFLTIYFDGCLTTLGIHPKTHLIQTIAYRGRGPQSKFQTLVQLLSDYRKVKGVYLPHTRQTEYQDASFGSSLDYAIKINHEVDFSRFRRGDSKRTQQK